MKFGIVILAAVLTFFMSPSDGTEIDVIRIFDPDVRNLTMSREELNNVMKKANLEKYGFVKTVEVSTVTDENDKETTKTSVLYSVTDDCSKVMFWERLLEQRLPAELVGSNIFTNTTKEVRSRIAGRRTKFCKFGVEIHPREDANERGVVKRDAPVHRATVDCCCKSEIGYS